MTLLILTVWVGYEQCHRCVANCGPLFSIIKSKVLAIVLRGEGIMPKDRVEVLTLVCDQPVATGLRLRLFATR